MRKWYAKPADMSSPRFWREYSLVKAEDVPFADQSHPQNANLVNYRGSKCWSKPVVNDIADGVYQREVDTYRRIAKAGLHSRIRVPKLQSLVVGEKEISIHGMIMDHEPQRSSLWDRRQAADIDLRKRYDKVTRMLGLLHAADITWGDSRPENMILDAQDDLWLIDFGGGFTDGWIDGQKIETKEGDLQGLAKFKKFLRLE